MDWKLEVLVVPVSDVDRAKEFYGDGCGEGVDPVERHPEPAHPQHVPHPHPHADVGG
jgi:hypothetical protein